MSHDEDLACRCSWHDVDDTLSCVVSPKTNLRHCFGCDAGGSVINWALVTQTYGADQCAVFIWWVSPPCPTAMPYFHHYVMRDPVGVLMTRFATQSEQLFRRFVSEDSGAFRAAKKAYYLLGRRG